MPLKLGSRIKSARMDNRMSQAGLSERLKVSQSAVAHWERAKNAPNLIQLQELAKELAVDANWLAFGLNDKRAKVEVIGIVKAGIINSDVPPSNKFIEMPPMGNEDQLVQAILVADNSMYPIYRAGDVIYVAQAAGMIPEIAEDQSEAYIESECGVITIARISQSQQEGRWDVHPLVGPPAMGKHIRWAKLILWVKKNHTNKKIDTTGGYRDQKMVALMDALPIRKKAGAKVN